MKNLVGRASPPARRSAQAGVIPEELSGRVKTGGINEKKPGTQSGLLARRGINSGFPRLLEVTEPFSIFPSGSRRTLVRNVPWPSSLSRRQSRHLSPLPAISAQPALGNLGSAAGFCSVPRQVAMKSNPEGDPALGRVRPDGRLPVTCFTGAQTELGSNYIVTTLGEKTRGQGDFLKNNFGGSR